MSHYRERLRQISERFFHDRGGDDVNLREDVILPVVQGPGTTVWNSRDRHRYENFTRVLGAGEGGLGVYEITTSQVPVGHVWVIQAAGVLHVDSPGSHLLQPAIVRENSGGTSSTVPVGPSREVGINELVEWTALPVVLAAGARVAISTPGLTIPGSINLVAAVSFLDLEVGEPIPPPFI